MKNVKFRDHSQIYWQKNQRFIVIFGVFLCSFMVLMGLKLQDLKAEDGVTFLSSPEAQSQISQREISLIVTDEGYYPESLVAFTGEKVRFFVTATTELPSCLIIEGKDLFVEAKSGQVHHGELTFQSPGVYRYYCPKGQIRGSLTVLEHPQIVRARERSREIAQEKRSKEVKVWLPRDE